MSQAPTPEPVLPPASGKPTDPAEFAALVNEVGPRVVRFIERIIGRRDLAEDLGQEVFVHLLRHPGEWPPADRRMVWILRIARNVALDHLRRHQVRRKAKSLLEEWAAAREASRARRPSAPPLEKLSDAELKSLLKDCIKQIPEVYRLPLVLREQEELSYEEIAEVLDLSSKTVSTRLVRARRHLRQRLEERLGSNAYPALLTGDEA